MSPTIVNMKCKCPCGEIFIRELSVFAIKRIREASAKAWDEDGYLVCECEKCAS